MSKWYKCKHISLPATKALVPHMEAGYAQAWLPLSAYIIANNSLDNNSQLQLSPPYLTLAPFREKL